MRCNPALHCQERQTHNSKPSPQDILPFIETHWDGMTTMSRRVTTTWHATILKAIQKELGTYFRAGEGDNFALKNRCTLL